jgi:hypothetical protein
VIQFLPLPSAEEDLEEREKEIEEKKKQAEKKDAEVSTKSSQSRQIIPGYICHWILHSVSYD